MATDRLRVAFALPELETGGPDRVVFEIIAGLSRERFEPVLIVGRATGGYFQQLPPDVGVEVIGGGRYPVRGLVGAVRRARPDVLFTTLRMNLTAAFARPFLPRGLRHVARLANQFTDDFAQLKKTSLIKHRLAEAVTRWALTRPDALVCQSLAMRADLAAVLGRAAPPMVVIGNPIDLDTVRARAAEPQAPPPGAPSLLAVGRLAAQKGFDVLVQAVPAVLRRHPGAVLTILGEGEERERLEAAAAALGVRHAVRLPGRSPNPLPAMAASDLLVSSSRYEGFANVILEAMAVGCPVVATDCPGATREMVLEGRTGWLAAPDSPEALADAIVRGLAGDRRGVSIKAAAYCVEHYAPTHILAAYEAVLAPETVGGIPRAPR